MKTVLLFDMDDTLFDKSLFLEKFIKLLSLKSGNSFEETSEKVFSTYEEARKFAGYHNPTTFLSRLSGKFELAPKDLEDTFFSGDNFKDSFFEDTFEVLSKLSKKYQIGIFSKGDKKFQSKKAHYLKDFVKERDIHIYEDKIANLNKVFDQYKDYKIILIDDGADVLTKAKELNPQIFTILVLRDTQTLENRPLIDKKVYNLKEISDFL